MSQSLIIESQYFPPISSISAISKVDQVYIEAHETYQKRSFRNRCYLIGPNGINHASVPLRKGKHQQLPISEVLISYDTPWHKNFLKLCTSHYGRSPYFDYVFPVIRNLLEKEYESLFELNEAILEWILDFLEIEAQLLHTTAYQKKYDEPTINLRAVTTVKNFHTYALPPYQQVFLERHGFISNVSILDLLFCMGKESVYYF